MKPPEFTGERYIPGQGGAQIAYEHLHRYLFAMRWARGRQVLDVAAGTGYGAELLSHVAERVWAVELDGPTVRYARATCRAANLLFVQSDGICLPFCNATMDVVVAMEVLEHIADQDALIREVARVVQPEGIVVISTPNKATYTDERQYCNPFHVKELYQHELLHMLEQYFTQVQLLDQQVRAGSLISSDNPSAQGSDVITQYPPTQNRVVSPTMYFVAVCSKGKALADFPAASAYIDPTDLLLQEWLQETAKLNQEIVDLGRWGRDLEEEIRKRDETLRGVFEEVDARDRTIRHLQEEMKEEIALRDDSLSKLRKEFEDRSRWAIALQEEVAERDQKLKQTNLTLTQAMADLHQVAGHLARIRHASLYRVLCRLGILPR